MVQALVLSRDGASFAAVVVPPSTRLADGSEAARKAGLQTTLLVFRGDCREVGGAVPCRAGYDRPGVSPAGDREWAGYCAWWRAGSRVRRAASMCWRSSVPGIWAIWRISV